MRKLNLILLAMSMGCSFVVQARENVGPNGFRVTQGSGTTAACVPATSKRDLDYNNVKALIMNGGDMWWDQGLGLPRYEIPKGSGKHSQFAASLWIGGIDAGGQLKIAAQTYRQTGNDFWPGALDVSTASITDEGCTAYDKHYLMYRDSVARFLEWRNDPTSVPGYQIPSMILDWPGNGNAARNEDQFLAPFIDSNGDGVYDPLSGDYPAYDLTSQSTPGNCTGYIYGDQTLFWVFNDKGNIHTETGGQAIGIEVRAQAFSFATNDEINNMTFYTYQVINRSTFTLNDTYFANWSDPDLGDYSDDFVGCDVPSGLGFCYNGDEDDGTGQGNSYGKNPPASGVDFFQGPLRDPDGTDNDTSQTISGTGFGDGITDNERLGMEIFMVFKNDGTLEGNPSNATHFYNYMRAKWKDGLNLTYGENGRNPANPETKFAFPWVSDPNNPTNWEAAEAKDWRFVHSAGPFTLKPGAVNYVTVGAVWARANSGGPKASVDLLKEADIKAQALFDNCFKVLNGPDAPDVDVRELNREVILYLSNARRSNNYLERYEEIDPLIGGLGVDNTYNFQGYLIYQLKDANVAQTELDDIDRARVVAQCDVRDGVGALVNHYFDATLNANLPVLENPTNAEYDRGIKHSFRITEDAFATGQDKRLVNHKTYYYMAVAYGYNNFKTFNPNDPNALDGQKKPFIGGRLNLKVTTAIPSIPAWANGGSTMQATYGMGPQLTRIEGQGNGGNVLELSDETVEQILASTDARVISPEYKNGNGPVDIKVVDPLNVPESDFEIRFLANTARRESIDSARWVINQLSSSGEIIASVSSDTSILVENEQLILDWGLSVRAVQVADPGVNPSQNNNGFIEATFENEDVTRPWLAGIPDVDGQFPLNWIRSGTTTFPDPLPGPPNYQGNDYLGIDDGQFYEGLNFGTVAPYRLASSEVYGPAWNKNQALTDMRNLASVDIVITSDKSKWTRSPVLELQDDSTLAEGRAKKLNLRKGASVDKDGKPDGTGTGMGWFPGYAINQETGERLNIAFGENSWLVGENGRDMIWNPTSSLFSNFLAPQGFNDPLFGGMHYVYVFGHNGNGNNDCPRYDNGEWIRQKLAFVAGTAGTTGDPDKRAVYKDAMWVFSPLLNPGFQMLENEVKIRIRVRKPYEMAYASNPFLSTPGNPFDPSAPVATSPVNNNNPTYRFSTRDLATLKNRAEVQKSALDLIKVVPNPYYAYSAYERSNLDNVVKITNLPEVCTVKIYSVNGTLIRQYDKDDPKTSLNWDLKNQKNVPIASGLYIIHVNVPNVGEKVLKWFGSIRPIDVDQF
jgi:hypothetical protein